MKKYLTTLAIVLTLAVTSCAHMRSNQTKTTTYDTNNVPIITEVTTFTGYTLFDAENSLTKFAANQTGTNQSTYFGGLNQNSSSSNLVAIAQILLQLAAKAP